MGTTFKFVNIQSSGKVKPISDELGSIQVKRLSDPVFSHHLDAAVKFAVENPDSNLVCDLLCDSGLDVTLTVRDKDGIVQFKRHKRSSDQNAYFGFTLDPGVYNFEVEIPSQEEEKIATKIKNKILGKKDDGGDQSPVEGERNAS
jgi:hypothetical protein